MFKKDLIRKIHINEKKLDSIKKKHDINGKFLFFN